jgi:OOP family OmpA-OmpF porin
MMKKHLALMAMLSTTSVAANAAALSQCEKQAANYQYCDNQLGWYIGAALGMAQTAIDEGKIERLFEQKSLDINNLALDDDHLGGNLFLGYQVNSYLAFEAGYLDLGEREVTFSGQAGDLSAYYDSAEHIYPQSGDGTLVALVASWPVSEKLKLSAKVGYFDWQGDYITFDQQGNQGSDTISGSDIVLGAEVNYRLSEQTQLFGAYQRVKLSRDDNDMFSIGLRYYFGQKPQYRPSAKPTPAPMAPEKQLVVAKPKDSDLDGVYDDQDVCADSPRQYQVDSRGCTLEKAQWVDFSLVINYANNSTKIDVKYNDKIVELAEFINKYKVKALTVFGHTSATGNDAYNMKLSKQRANSVAQKLSEDFAINAGIIEAVGKGESELKFAGNSEQAHLQNRRIELTIKERLVVPVKR